MVVATEGKLHENEQVLNEERCVVSCDFLIYTLQSICSFVFVNYH